RSVAPHDNGTSGPLFDRRLVGRAVLLVAGAGLLLGGLTSGQAGAAVVLVGVGAPLAAWSFVRLVPPGTARAAPGLPAAILVRGVLTFSFFGTDAFVPLALTEVRREPGWVVVALTA